MNKKELDDLISILLGGITLAVSVIPALIYVVFFQFLPALLLAAFFAGIIAIAIYYLLFTFIPFQYIWLVCTVLLVVAIYFPDLLTKEK